MLKPCALHFIAKLFCKLPRQSQPVVRPILLAFLNSSSLEARPAHSKAKQLHTRCCSEGRHTLLPCTCLEGLLRSRSKRVPIPRGAAGLSFTPKYRIRVRHSALCFYVHHYIVRHADQVVAAAQAATRNGEAQLSGIPDIADTSTLQLGDASGGPPLPTQALPPYRDASTTAPVPLERSASKLCTWLSVLQRHISAAHRPYTLVFRNLPRSVHGHHTIV